VPGSPKASKASSERAVATVVLTHSVPFRARPICTSWKLTRCCSLILLLLFASALAARVTSLDAAGFSEDEMDKLRGAQAYSRGDFAFDGEHPALMKLAVLGSLSAASAWNAHTPTRAPIIRTETAVRLPNAIAGAAIAIVLFLLVTHWFSPLAGLLAAWLWAFDVNAIAINRIAKEDTFVVLFLLVASLCYEWAKTIGRTNPTRAQRWFAAAGAAFGLMLASKYVPYFVGIHILYFRIAEPHPGSNRADKPTYFGAMALAFLIANFPVLLPGNWMTIASFLSEHAVQHTGYVFQDRLWPNTLSSTPAGLPPWFYLADLLTKIPLAVLATSAIGVWRLSHRHDRGAMYVLTFILLTLLPYSLVATKFLRYMLPTLAMLDVAAAVAIADGVALVSSARSAAAHRIVAAGAAVVLLAPLAAWLQARPLSALYRNVLGARVSPDRLWFAPDELYDAGLREAVTDVARIAPAHARLVTDAPAVVAFYAAAMGRSDLRIARPEHDTPRPDDWFIVQQGRVYFENYAAVQKARERPPLLAVDVRGFRAAEVYRTW
jgi:hypothetical protein